MGIWIASMLMLYASMFDSHQEQATELQKRDSVAGNVVESTSDEPVRKALVILQGGDRPGLGTITDATGKFTLHNVEAGSYTVSVRRDGYVFIPEGGRQELTVKAGEPISDLKLKLVRAGAISGRIVDADGDPISGVSVQISPWRPKKANPIGGTQAGAGTNDRGEYRAFNIAPGDYAVSVVYSVETENMGVRLQRPAGDNGPLSAGIYPTVYYPGTIDARQATVVKLGPGMEVQNIDIQLIRAHGVQVRGRVTGLPDSDPTASVHVSLQPVERQGQLEQSRSSVVRGAKGEFEFTDVLPGTYRLRAGYYRFAEEGSRLMARQKLEVGDSDIDGIQLTLTRPGKVTGRIMTPVGRKASPSLMVLLASREVGDSQGGGFARVSAAGDFVINNVPPGDYDVTVEWLSGTADDLYVDAIRSGDIDVLVEGMQIGEESPGSLEIILKAKGGTMEFTVTSDTGEAVRQAQVILVPGAPRQRQVPLYRQCITEANGSCTITGIRPGEYHAFAFPVVIGIDYRDADALEPFMKYATATRIGEGERLQVGLKSTPEDEADDPGAFR
jgi:Carboxypeptidase regulatory-like domain